MTLLRLRHLVLTAVAVAVLVAIALSAVDPSGSRVRLTWTVPAGLGALALVMLAAGWPVRQWNRQLGRRRAARTGGREAAAALRRIDPLRATRVLALARASAFAGAALAGAYAGIAVLTAPTAEFAPRRARLVLALLAAVGAAALSVVGVLVERWCRVPPEDQDDPRGPLAL